MAFNTTSYLAGIGTAVFAIILGLAGGSMIMSGPKVEQPNRLQRVVSSSIYSSAVQVANVGQESPSASIPPNEVVATKPQPVAERTDLPPGPQPAAPPLPVVAKGEDATSALKVEDAKIRAAELKRNAERRRNEAIKLAERKKRQEIELAANAVRQMKRDGVLQSVVLRDEAPRAGFFGDN